MLVIWLPVIKTDKGPPSDLVRDPLDDPRVIEFWDPGRWASPRMIERASMMIRDRGQEPEFGPDAIAWDLIAMYPAGLAWEDPFPSPSWSGAPVVEHLEKIERFFSDAAPME